MTFEIFTNRARRSILLAESQAQELGSPYVRPEHLLLGLLAEGEGVAWIELTRLGADLDGIRDYVAGRPDSDAALEAVIGLDPGAIRARFIGDDDTGRPVLDRKSRRVLWAARAEAALLHHRYVGTEHLLLGLTSDEDDAVSVLVDRMGIDRATLRRNVAEAVAPQQVRLDRALREFFAIRSTLTDEQTGDPNVEKVLEELNSEVLGVLNEAYVEEEVKAAEIARRVEDAVAKSAAELGKAG